MIIKAKDQEDFRVEVYDRLTRMSKWITLRYTHIPENSPMSQDEIDFARDVYNRFVKKRGLRQKYVDEMWRKECERYRVVAKRSNTALYIQCDTDDSLMRVGGN